MTYRKTSSRELPSLTESPQRPLAAGPVQTGSVVDIVLRRFPYVDDGTSWEQILDFRNDPSVKAKRNALRRWMSGIASKPRKPVEIEQEIDCLLWLANCYFPRDSSGFSVLLPFFDA